MSIDNVYFTPTTVRAAIKKMKPSKSSRPDNFSPFLFKQLDSSLAEPLAMMYSVCMSVGRMPSERAHAIVAPVFKSGDAAITPIYRPISLTNVSCKIMECIISNDLLHYLRSHNVITKQQHSFLSGKSTCAGNTK